MKKHTSKATPTKTLVLRKHTIQVLRTPALDHVVGGMNPSRETCWMGCESHIPI